MNNKPKILSLDDRLALVARKFDKVSHIEVDQEKFKQSDEKVVLFLCPAKVYVLNEETGECTVNFDNCVECGTCQTACPEYIKWKNPHGALGISYKYG
ncbi:MAG: 4Fe-4S dicluster domain-containing protein, partial [Candidatus Omnitrophota bacterium]|nr:4Fe-4S dicluster domain-containing protein [Candidatus Omnitrophota bacterium]